MSRKWRLAMWLATWWLWAVSGVVEAIRNPENARLALSVAAFAFLMAILVIWRYERGTA